MQKLHKISGIIFVCLTLGFTPCNSQAIEKEQACSTLYYTAPATQWEETLPLGNGRLGIMPDGNPSHEKIVLNEISMWSGSVTDYRNPDAAASLPEIRALLFAGKNKEAQELMYKRFVPKVPNEGGSYGSFQILGNLAIDYPLSGIPTQYKRSLNLNTSIATTSFTLNGVTYNRDYFVSRTQDVILIHLTANKKGCINFTYGINRPVNDSLSRQATLDSKGQLVLKGQLDSGQPGITGINYAILTNVSVLGEQAQKETRGTSIAVSGADEAWIIVSAATSYFEGNDYLTHAQEGLHAIIPAVLPELKSDAVKAYQTLYNRATLFLESGTNSLLPTDERIRLFLQEEDPALAALYYNYGRYLLICSTRPHSLPPNLQGLWANTTQTPWNGDYHTNINVQMNHWPVEQGNLSELHQPLIELTKSLVKSGEETAKAFYGKDAKGWVAHMKTNIWQYTAPGEHPSWGATNTGGAWLCAHLWEHYLYTGDKNYLEEIYPIMKGASEFFYSTMVKEPKHGWLVTAPTSSPENAFYVGKDREPISVCMGPTMDTEIIHELYTNVIAAAKILNKDKSYCKQLTAAMQQFPPLQISQKGYLMEWLEDYEEVDIHHRHVSHLYALHPGNQISVVNTPKLADACRVTLNRRGDEGTGWSRAWKINFWARLHDGNRAYKLFKSLLTPAYTPDSPARHGSGTFPNLFCSHPPFQMDGNWGGTSGISEMLLQSQDNFINLLPALPDAWKEGNLRGFKVRGGAQIDIDWFNGRAQKAVLIGGFKEENHIKMPDHCKQVTVIKGKKRQTFFSPYFDIKVKNGEKIQLLFE